MGIRNMFSRVLPRAKVSIGARARRYTAGIDDVNVAPVAAPSSFFVGAKTCVVMALRLAVHAAFSVALVCQRRVATIWETHKLYRRHKHVQGHIKMKNGERITLRDFWVGSKIATGIDKNGTKTHLLYYIK